MSWNGRRTLALWLHVATVAAAPAAIGGVHTPTAVALLVPALAALLVQLRWRSRERLGYAPPPFLWVLVGLAAAIGLQLAPLPPALLGVLSPQAAALRADAAALAGLETGWMPLSLAPPATARDLLRALAVLATFAGLAGLVRVRPRAGATALTAIVATGVALVAVAVVQQAFGADTILGLYEPRTTQGHRFFWSTFVNQNHFAAFLCLAAPLALGLALDRSTPRGRAIPLVVAFAVLATGAILTLSRAGALVLAGELALFGLLWWVGGRRRRADERESSRPSGAVGWGAVAVVVLAAVAITLVVALPHLTAEWRALGDPAAESVPKWGSWPDAWRLALAFPWTGAGAGAFAEVFPAFNAAFPDHTFHYAENGPLQLAADLGLPLAILFLAAAVLLFVPLVLRSVRRPLLIGAAVGVLGVAIENLADFSLALPGVALPTAAALGVLAGKARRPERRSADGDAGGEPAAEGGRGRTRLALALLAVAVVAAVPASWLALDGGLGRAREAVAAGTPGATAEAAQRHPADPVVVLAAGQRALLAGDRTAAGAWFARAQRLSPHGALPALHILRLALVDGDAERARAALRTLFADHPGRSADRREALRLLRGREDAAALLGPAVDWNPAILVAAVTGLRGLGAAQTAERLLRAALAERADDAALLRSLTELYLAAGRRDAADRIATRLMALHPTRPDGYLVLGELALAAADDVLAEHLFREAARLAPDEPRPLFRRADALIRLGDWGPLEAVLRTLASRARTPRERAEVHFLRSRAAQRQGELKTALGFAREAVSTLPRHVPYLRQLATLLEALERPDSALPIYERILELDHRDRAAARAVTRLRGGTVRGADAPLPPVDRRGLDAP
jgi:tetratricopeptide (TPR) repeat protein/O-antigen ligase